MTNGQPHKCHKNIDHWHLPWRVQFHLMAISHQLYSFLIFWSLSNLPAGIVDSIAEQNPSEQMRGKEK